MTTGKVHLCKIKSNSLSVAGESYARPFAAIAARSGHACGSRGCTKWSRNLRIGLPPLNAKRISRPGRRRRRRKIKEPGQTINGVSEGEVDEEVREEKQCQEIGDKKGKEEINPYYYTNMNMLLLVLVLLLLLGGGGFYLGGPVFGGSAVGLILLICLIIFLMGGFRTRG
jgi:hypothetical protein